MQLTILGSGTNVHPSRAAAGYLIQTDQLFLLDFGPRTLMNLARTGTSRHEVRTVLFSHYHADHFSDFITFFFDAVYYSRYVGKRPDLTIIGPPGTRKLFGLILRTFPGFDAAAFRVDLREVADDEIRIGRTTVIARTVVHSPRLHCLGYRVEHDDRMLAYSGDAQYCSSVVDLCSRAHVAVLDCSFPSTRPGPGHMHAGQCGQVAHEAGARRLILSHFYPIAERYDVKRQAGQCFGGRITKARDRMRIRI